MTRIALWSRCSLCLRQQRAQCGYVAGAKRSPILHAKPPLLKNLHGLDGLSGRSPVRATLNKPRQRTHAGRRRSDLIPTGRRTTFLVAQWACFLGLLARFAPSWAHICHQPLPAEVGVGRCQNRECTRRVLGKVSVLSLKPRACSSSPTLASRATPCLLPLSRRRNFKTVVAPGTCSRPG